MSASLLQACQLHLARGPRTLVSQLDFEVRAGERVAILGRNGAGKTTLLLALAGLNRPLSGEILWQGSAITQVPARQAARWRGLLLQTPPPTLGASVWETALLGRHPHIPFLCSESEEDRAIARRALEAVGLGALHHRNADTLSGGERQRLAMATLLAQDPTLLLLDEPLTHLDLGVQSALIGRLFRKAEEKNGAVVMSLHDPSLARRLCTHALLLFDHGQWLFGPVAHTLTENTLGKLHGCAFRSVQDGPYPIFLPG
jgi:iron complex transport system ATP-binding protein